jgi:Fe2+ transport system protein FeoA
MTDLRHVPLDEPYRIIAVVGDSTSAQRVRELGLLPGTLFRIVRKAPFGGPYEIALDRRRIGLRLTDEILITAEAA